MSFSDPITFGLENHMTMEKGKRFKALVTSRFNPFQDYTRGVFSFKTLFYQSIHYYYCCQCSFEHEYIDYVSETRTIDEEMLDRVAQNIINGYCPHAKITFPHNYLLESLKHIRETKVHALHIAAALNKRARTPDTMSSEDMKSGIYALYPTDIAVMKNCDNFLRSYYTQMKEGSEENAPYYSYSGTLKYGFRAHGKGCNVTFRKQSALEICIASRNKEALKILLDPGIIHFNISKGLELILEHGRLSDFLEDILAYIKVFRCEDRVPCLERCAVSAIVYENNYVLSVILDVLKTCKWTDDLQRNFQYICDVLGKPGQKEIILKYQRPYSKSGTDHFRLKVLHYLLQNYGDKYTDELKTAFKALTKYTSAVDHAYNNCAKKTPLHNCFDRYYNSKLNPRISELLFQYGANQDILDSHGNTPLLVLLDSAPKTNIQNFLYGFALLICENPDVELNRSAFKAAIKLDERFERDGIAFSIEGNYILDARKRCMISGDEFCEKVYLGPLLIECGFHYDQDVLQGIGFDETVKKCINFCSSNPRSLKLSCRDTLRRHFKRHDLHKYVNNVLMPEGIRDFILIKPYLLFNQPS